MVKNGKYKLESTVNFNEYLVKVVGLSEDEAIAFEKRKLTITVAKEGKIITMNITEVDAPNEIDIFNSKLIIDEEVEETITEGATVKSFTTEAGDNLIVESKDQSGMETLRTYIFTDTGLEEVLKSGAIELKCIYKKVDV